MSKSSTTKDNLEWKSLYNDYCKYLSLLKNTCVNHIEILGACSISSPRIDEYTKSSVYSALTKLKLKLGLICTIYITNQKINLSEEHIDFSLFPQLAYLKLDGCSITVIHKIFFLHESLKTLSIENLNINGDTNIFLDINQRIGKNERIPKNYTTNNSSLYWKKLIKLKLSYCNLEEIENYFALFPNVTSLNLSHNHISEIKNLQNCKYLESFDISYNNISHISEISSNCKNVKRLNLSHNTIKNLPSSFRYLIQLEKLILSYNQISDFYELTSLSQMKSLIEIVVMGNPLSLSKYYRCLVFYSILGSKLSLSLSLSKYGTSSKVSLSLSLDGSSISKHEIQAVRLLLHTPEESLDQNQSFHSSKSMVIGSAKVVQLEQMMSTKFSHLWRDPKRWSLNHSRHLHLLSDPTYYDDNYDGDNNLLTSNSCNSGTSSLNHRVTSKRKIRCHGRRLVNIYDCWNVNLFPIKDNIDDDDYYIQGVYVNVLDASSVWLVRRRLENQVKEVTIVVDISTTMQPSFSENKVITSPNELQSDEVMRLESIEINSSELHLRNNNNDNIIPVMDLPECSVSVFVSTGGNVICSDDNILSFDAQVGNEPSQHLVDLIFPARYPQTPPRNSYSTVSTNGSNNLISTDTLDQTTVVKENSSNYDSDFNSYDAHSKDNKVDPTAVSTSNISSPSTATSSPSIKRYFSRKMFPFTSPSPRKSGMPSPNQYIDIQKQQAQENNILQYNSLSDDNQSKKSSSPIATTPTRVVERCASGSSPVSMKVVSSFPSQDILSDLSQNKQSELPSIISLQNHETDKDIDKEWLWKRYTGNSEYISFLIIDHLELYFREQVFGIFRPSYPSPYIKYIYNNSQDNSNNNMIISTSTLPSFRQKSLIFHDGGSISYLNGRYSDFIPANAITERFICLFRESVIFLNDNYSNSNSYPNANTTTDSDTNSIARSDLEEGDLDSNSIGTGTGGGGGEEEEEDGYDDKVSYQKETSVLIVMTNQYVYFLKDLIPSEQFITNNYDREDTNSDTTTTTALFNDAPIPLLIGRHSLLSIRRLTTFFGFTRLALHFSDDNNDPMTTLTSNRETSDCMIIFRNKSKAHSFLNILNMATNTCALKSTGEASVNMMLASPPLPLSSYIIENMDSQFLEGVTACLQTLSVSTSSRPYDMEDVQYVQMVFQVWRKKPGIKQPRTIVLTRSRLLLFDEQLDSLEVKLKLVNSVRAKRVARVISEDDDNSLRLTLVLKGSEANSSNVFAFRRKWRLETESRESLWKLRDECRRVCAEDGNIV